MTSHSQLARHRRIHGDFQPPRDPPSRTWQLGHAALPWSLPGTQERAPGRHKEKLMDHSLNTGTLAHVRQSYQHKEDPMDHLLESQLLTQAAHAGSVDRRHVLKTLGGASAALLLGGALNRFPSTAGAA